MMMPSKLFLAVLLAFAAPAAFAMDMHSGTVAFNATVFSDDPNPGATVFTSHLDKATDTIYWKFNFTEPGVEGLQALQIRDGKKGMDVLAIDLQTFDSAFTGVQNFTGNFSSGINVVVAGNATELANHMCMGHIYAVVQAAAGPQRAVINYNPKDSGIADCYEAVGLGGSHSMPGMTMPGASAPGPATVPASSGSRVSTALTVVAAALLVITMA